MLDLPAQYYSGLSERRHIRGGEFGATERSGGAPALGGAAAGGLQMYRQGQSGVA